MALGKLYQKLTYELNNRQDEIRGLRRINNARRRLAKIGLKKAPKSEQKSISEYEWENLIILDSCRHDRYEKVANKKIEYRFSKGSRSPQFIEEELVKEKFEDTILISANPFTISEIMMKREDKEIDLSENFYEVYNLLNEEDFYNEEKGTVTAERINYFLETVEKLYPHKKKIIWYMQPHIPFLKSNISSSKLNEKGENTWDQLRKNKISKEEFLESYDKEISSVRNKALKAEQNILNGRTIITSDHGNFIGEHGLFGHGYTSNEIQLRKVPLEIIEG